MGMIQSVWGILKAFLGYQGIVGNYLWWLASSFLFAFPGDWYVWPAWIGWWVLLTQPHAVDTVWHGFDKAQSFAGYVIRPKTVPGLGFVFGLPMIGWVLLGLYYYFAFWAVVFAIAVQYSKITRFVVTVAAINLMVHAKAGAILLEKLDMAEGSSAATLLTARLVVAYSGAVMAFVWWHFFHDKKHREHVLHELHEHGYFKGWFYLLLEDFVHFDHNKVECHAPIPAKDKEGKALLKTDGTPKTKACGAVNKQGDRNCKECGTPLYRHCKNKDCKNETFAEDAKKCPKCGSDIVDPDRPEGCTSLPPPGPTPASAPATEEACANCHKLTPIQFKLCKHCKKPRSVQAQPAAPTPAPAPPPPAPVPTGKYELPPPEHRQRRRV